MITTGFTLAILTATGFYFIYRKLPRRIRRFMNKHILFTDAITCLMTYMLFGGTLVALFAAAWMGVMVSIMLALTAHPTTNAILQRFGNKCGELKDKFVGWAEEHMPELPDEEKPKLKEVA